MSTCKVCQKHFAVASEDKALLKKFDLPDPKLCFAHALQRRFAWRNERYLYRRNCERCGKSILAMFSKDAYAHVYCRQCWYSDAWDPLQYGRDYDPQKSFFEQWFELAKVVPQYNIVHIGENVNCDYANFSYNSKDAHLSYSVYHCEGIVYSGNTDYCRDCVDSFHIFKGELLYDCVDTKQSYRSAFLTRCEQCTECYLSNNLFDCQNCFGCVNLKHKQFYWYNAPLSREAYQRRLAEALATRENFEKHQKQFAEHALKFPVAYADIKESENATGEDIARCRNIRNGFNLKEDENMSDVFRSYYSKDCYRMSYAATVGMIYEFITGANMTESFCSAFCSDSFLLAYCQLCYNSENLFGCVGLRNKKFCILNKQYSEQEYHTLRKQIIEKMCADGEWGEFFPVRLSPQAYNETLAQDYYPLSKEEVMENKWRYNDDLGGVHGKETLRSKEVPDAIHKIQESITKEILTCTRCGLNYRIEPREYSLLKSLSLPIPLECQYCRFKKRFGRHYVPQLYSRQCQCEFQHQEHAENRCPEKFRTPYAPNRLEKVFCKSCYQEEII